MALEFGKKEITEINNQYRRLRDSVLDEVNIRLKKRDPNAGSYLKTDDEIFQSFVEAYILSIMVTPFASMAKEIGVLILHDIREYEQQHSITLNKESFHFALAMLSIGMNDDVNAVIYWELANRDHANTVGTQLSSDDLIDKLQTTFKTIYSPIRDAYTQNNFIYHNSAKYPFLKTFDNLIKGLNGIDRLHLVSNFVRNKKMQLWLRNYSYADLIRIYSQELIISLSILGESLLKELLGVTGKTLGPIIKQDLPNINGAISTLINGPIQNLFTTYPTNSIATFNANYLALISAIETNNLTEDDFKAHLLYGLYMIRNQVLHQFDDSIIYYNNPLLFEKTIGLLFANISVVTTL